MTGIFYVESLAVKMLRDLPQHRLLLAIQKLPDIGHFFDLPEDWIERQLDEAFTLLCTS